MPSPFQELTLIGGNYYKLNKIIDSAILDSDQYSIRNIVSGDFKGDGLPDILLNSNDQKVQGAGGARTPAWLFLQNKLGIWVESEIVDLAKSVADSDANLANIDLIGLSSTGIEFFLG